MTPWVILAVFVILGAAVGGGSGGVAGFLVGVAFNLALGWIVRRAQGGLLPRRVRRDLAIKLMQHHTDVVREAFPDVDGIDLFEAVDRALEVVAREAVRTSPNNSVIWSAPVMIQALGNLHDAAPRQAMREFYLVIADRIGQDWYVPSRSV